MTAGRKRSPLLDALRDAIRVRHYSIRTEKQYVFWARRFVLFHNKRHPGEMGELEVMAFLTHLAVAHHVSPSTQNQALNALVFLYKHVLKRPLGEIDGVVRAKRQQRLPVVLTPEEVAGVLDNLRGIHWLVACLQYGSGLRLLESIRLRVKDLDFPHRAVIVREGKGGKDRVVTLPDELIGPLKRHLANRRTMFDGDRRAGVGNVLGLGAGAAASSRRESTTPRGLSRERCAQDTRTYLCGFNAASLSLAPRRLVGAIGRSVHLNVSLSRDCRSARGMAQGGMALSWWAPRRVTGSAADLVDGVAPWRPSASLASSAPGFLSPVGAPWRP
jgi:integrase